MDFEKITKPSAEDLKDKTKIREINKMLINKIGTPNVFLGTYDNQKDGVLVKVGREWYLFSKDGNDKKSYAPDLTRAMKKLNPTEVFSTVGKNDLYVLK